MSNAYTPASRPEDGPPLQMAPPSPYQSAPERAAQALALAAAPYNTLAIIALVSSLVVAPAGIICGHIALNQLKQVPARGRGFALAGTIIGYSWFGIFVLMFTGGILSAVLAR